MKADKQILAENAGPVKEEKIILKNTFTGFNNEIEEIISNKPPLIVRWGTLIFFFLLLVLVAVSWFVRYPDIVTTSAKLSSFNPPKPVVCGTAGNLLEFRVKEGDHVQAAAIIGIIESSSDARELLALSASLESLTALLSKNNGMISPNFSIRPYKNLGGLQQAYQTFSHALIDFKNYLHGGYYEKKKLIQPLIFQQALDTFKSAVETWKQKYLLVAPVSGKVSLAGFLQKNQPLKAGQAICFINQGNSEYFAGIFIPQENFWKVKKAEKVLLKFSSYPSYEFGSVTGRLDFISSIPTDSGYAARIIFPDGLQTNYNKKIQYSEGLAAKAEIITNDMRLLERLYYNFLKHADQ